MNNLEAPKRLLNQFYETYTDVEKQHQSAIANAEETEKKPLIQKLNYSYRRDLLLIDRIYRGKPDSNKVERSFEEPKHKPAAFRVFLQQYGLDLPYVVQRLLYPSFSYLDHLTTLYYELEPQDRKKLEPLYTIIQKDQSEKAIAGLREFFNGYGIDFLTMDIPSIKQVFLGIPSIQSVSRITKCIQQDIRGLLNDSLATHTQILKEVEYSQDNYMQEFTTWKLAVKERTPWRREEQLDIKGLKNLYVIPNIADIGFKEIFLTDLEARVIHAQEIEQGTTIMCEKLPYLHKMHLPKNQEQEQDRVWFNLKFEHTNLTCIKDVLQAFPDSLEIQSTCFNVPKSIWMHFRQDVDEPPIEPVYTMIQYLLDKLPLINQYQPNEIISVSDQDTLVEIGDRTTRQECVVEDPTKIKMLDFLNTYFFEGMDKNIPFPDLSSFTEAEVLDTRMNYNLPEGLRKITTTKEATQKLIAAMNKYEDAKTAAPSTSESNGFDEVAQMMESDSLSVVPPQTGVQQAQISEAEEEPQAKRARLDSSDEEGPFNHFNPFGQNDELSGVSLDDYLPPTAYPFSSDTEGSSDDESSDL